MVTGGAGIGLILGLGYASFQRGVEANLEQGDTFEVVVGTTSYRPVPRTCADHPFPGSRSIKRQGTEVTTMKRGHSDHAIALPVLVVLGLAVSGCGQIERLLETKVLPEPTPPAQTRGFRRPTRVPRSMIPNCDSSPKSSRPGPWQLGTGGGHPAPLFSRVEVLPPTQTVLPYGVGAYEQEPRLPAILTIGPGWASQNPEEKEAVAAQAFRKLSQGLEALKLDPPLRPTLTIQTPSGLELAWMNDLNEGRRNIHGDDSQPLPALAAARRSRRHRRRRRREGKNIHGDER